MLFLLQQVDKRFLFLLFVIKGILISFLQYGLYSSIVFPLFQSMGVSMQGIQLIYIITYIPWVIKPLYGIISDLVGLFFYKKLFWLLQASMIGIAAVVVIIINNLQSIPITVLCLFLMNYQIAFLDLLCDGKYSEIMNDNPEVGNSIISYINLLTRIFMIGGTLLAGPIADSNMFGVVFFLIAVGSMMTLIAILYDCFPNDNFNYIAKINTELLNRYGPIICLILFSGANGLIVLVLQLLQLPPIYIILIQAGFIFIMLIISWNLLQKNIVKILLFNIITNVSSPYLGDAIEYYYTSCDSGPNFSFTFYITYVGIVGELFAIIGIIVYQLFLHKYKNRSLLVLLKIIISLTPIIDIIIMLITFSGVKVLFYIKIIIQRFFYAQYQILIFSLISKSCLTDIEASTYAFMSGMYDFAGLISSYEGLIVYNVMGLEAQKNDCSLGNLWLAILLFNVILPIIAALATAFLIPNKRPNEAIN
jgi:hypothetical protein